MDVEETKLVNRTVTVGKKCDVCEKVSKDIHDYSKWLNVSHRHYGWDNDSVESIEHFDICSINCLRTQLDDSLDEMQDHDDTAEIFGMSYPYAKELHRFISNKPLQEIVTKLKSYIQTLDKDIKEDIADIIDGALKQR